jgi:hypothetical protein
MLVLCLKHNVTWLLRLWRIRSALVGIWLCMGTDLSRHWGLAVMAHLITAQSIDQGKNWARKTILLLWNFANAMWEHQNLSCTIMSWKPPIRYVTPISMRRSLNCMLMLRPMMWRIDDILTCHWFCALRTTLLMLTMAY